MFTTLLGSMRAFPLYLAPMAGVTDKIFRQICKRYGADVLVTEFVSAEGVFRRNERTANISISPTANDRWAVQLFGANPAHMAEAAKQVVDWVAPDFIDLNFGCPVNKVVAKNGGSALLKDCPTLSSVAKAVVQAVAPLPVTAKIRIGWDANSINAVRVAEILQGCGMRGSGRSWPDSGARSLLARAGLEGVTIPVIGNGDLFSAQEVVRRRTETKIAGVMIGRAAMSAPWIFRQIKYYLVTGELLPAPELSERWNVIIEHCRRHADDWGDEEQAITFHARTA